MDTINQLIEELEYDAQEKRIVRPGFSQDRLEAAKPDLLTRGQRRKAALKRRQTTAGAQWFDMPTKDLGPEDKLAIDALRLRGALNRDRFYKRNATDKVSKAFQIGTVIEHPIDFYSSRATRKERKAEFVDELIADNSEVKKRFRRLKATQAIKQKEKALADRRKALQGKKKKKRQDK